MTLQLDILQSLGIAIIALVLGNLAKNKFSFLKTIFKDKDLIDVGRIEFLFVNEEVYDD